MTRTRRLATALALAAVLALAAFGWAQAAPVPITDPNTQHFLATVHTDFFGNATLNLQVPVTAQGDVIIKVASGATNLGGENPSFATVNFAGFVNASDRDSVNVRVIGWHANTVTGRAEFAYYSNKDVTIAVDVYPRTAAPVTVR